MRVVDFLRFGFTKRLIGWVLLAVFAVALPVSAKGLWSDTETVVSVAAMPKNAQKVYALILQGGPFAYDKDGTVFGNRERLLPKQPRGYYREYTVKTPGVSHRGAVRIVCGGEIPQQPKACYYSEDHYNSFRRIVQ